jgi:hypothetical protein
MPNFEVLEKHVSAKLSFTKEELIVLLDKAATFRTFPAKANISDNLSPEELYESVVGLLKSGYPSWDLFHELDFEAEIFEECGKTGLFFHDNDDLMYFSDSAHGRDFIANNFSHTESDFADNLTDENPTDEFNIYYCDNTDGYGYAKTLIYHILVNMEVKMTHELIVKIEKQPNGEFKITQTPTSNPQDWNL